MAWKRRDQRDIVAPTGSLDSRQDEAAAEFGKGMLRNERRNIVIDDAAHSRVFEVDSFQRRFR